MKMNNRSKRRRLPTNGSNAVAFFLNFLRSPQLIGSVIPSSRFLEQRIVDVARVDEARLVVELGPGTGGTTRAFLAAMPRDAKLLAIELNRNFVELLSEIRDPRLIVHHGSAENIGSILAELGLGKPEVVISGIPFSTMPEVTGRRILREVWSCLAANGRFVAYQFRGRVALLGRKILGRPAIEVELLNAPPMRVFHWRKQDTGEPLEEV